jgi:hypothetical protein
MKIHPPARNQLQTSEAGPPGREKDKVEAIDGMRPMTENAIPKTSIMAKLRLSSCLYPRLAVATFYQL